MIGKSSTFREFFALLRVTETFGDHLRGRKVLFVMDSQPLVRCLYNEGGKNEELTELYKQWLGVCIGLGIEPYSEWTPREGCDNDKLSKRVPLTWSLTPP